LSDVPSATVVQDGKLGGDVPKGGDGGAPKPRAPYKRKLSNYLLDKRLQLRYILLVTILSGVISGSLGYLIYQQRHAASESIERDLAALTQDDKSLKEFQEQVAAGMAAEDRALVYKMVGVGIGLVVILSLYLVIMTHKVAGPLYKISMYFDRMADGRLSNVTALRRGDMLQDFYGNFREMHEAVRTRMQSDVITMESAAVALRAKATADGSPGSRADVVEALDALDKHLTQRKKQLL
jgi:methyl-accepting chemotaxis protein